jgi:preprotein translocase SecE subunit
MTDASSGKVVVKTNKVGIFTRMGRFIKESYVETWHKASWPTWPELRQFTIVVIFAVVVISIWIGGLDVIFAKITAQIIK